MATKTDTIRQTTLSVDRFAGGPGGPGGDPALAGPSSLTDPSVADSLRSFINWAAFTAAGIVVLDVEVRGGGMAIVVFIAPLTKTRPISYQPLGGSSSDQNE